MSQEDTREDYGERWFRILALPGKRLHVAVITHRDDAITSSAFAKPTGSRSSGMAKKDDDRASLPDEDNSEWTREEIRTARPALETIAGAFGPEVAEALKRGRGRLSKADRKVNQTLRLDQDVLEASKGWEASGRRL